MRRLDDDSYLDAALRQSLARRTAPSSLKANVLSRIRGESEREAQREARDRFPWQHPWRMHWALGTCAAAAVVALVWSALPLQEEPSNMEAVAMESADLQLAEVLQLAGSKWNRAQEIALSPIQENGND